MVGLTPGAGGTQRMAERAGPGRAREFVMTGGLFDAATLERWNVVNRVLPDDELLEKGMRFAHRLASGPTVAHAATKRIVRAYLRGGVDEADRVTPEQFAGLFATEDLQERGRDLPRRRARQGDVRGPLSPLRFPSITNGTCCFRA